MEQRNQNPELMEQEVSELTPSKPPMGLEVIVREFTRDKIAIFSLLVILVIIVGALLGPYFLDLDQIITVDIFSRFKEPGIDGHILGTDEGGRDVLGQLILGTRNSLIIAWSVTFITAFIGISLGIMAGYYGGVVDDIMMRIVDFLLVLPQTMIIIVVVTIVRRFDVWTLIWIISLLGWMGITRLIRTAALSEGSKDYIAASKTMGTRDWKIMFGHLLPNLSSLLITNLTLSFAGNIGLETGLSFLGFGLPVGTPSLGTLIGYARSPDIIQNKTWVWLPAALLVLVMMVSINYIGQAFQRVADSKQRRG